MFAENIFTNQNLSAKFAIRVTLQRIVLDCRRRVLHRGDLDNGPEEGFNCNRGSGGYAICPCGWLGLNEAAIE